MISEIVARGWEDFVGRTSGPLHFRFFIQPLVSAVLGIQAGLADARMGRTPFLKAVVSARGGHAWKLLGTALRDLRTILIVGLVLDVVYQAAVLKGVYLLELVFTVTLLAVMPYLLIRGITLRIVTWRRAAAATRNDRIIRG